MRSKLILAAILGLFSGVCHAACDSTTAPTATTHFGISKPVINACGWGTTTNNNWDIVDSSAPCLSCTNTFTSTNTFNTLTVHGASGSNLEWSTDSPLIISHNGIFSFCDSNHPCTTLQSDASGNTVLTNTGFSTILTGGTSAGQITLSSVGGSGTSPTITMTGATVSVSSMTSSSQTVNGPFALNGEFKPGLTSSTSGQILVSQGANNSPKFQSSLFQVVMSSVATSSSTTTSNIFLPTSLSATIAPRFSSSRVMIHVYGSLAYTTIGGGDKGQLTIARAGSNLAGTSGIVDIRPGSAGIQVFTDASMGWIDSPATTSATTYTVYMLSSSASAATISFPAESNNTATMILEEIQ